MVETQPSHILAVIGLGNPGQRFEYTRHNIGFRVVDALVQEFQQHWQSKDNLEYAEITSDGKKIILVKPQTFMNSSGQAFNFLTKKGIKPDQMLIVHDELELPFCNLKFKFGGSHKGHNGLRSIISTIGPDFWRLRFGIGRPDQREDVPDYVLQKFAEQPAKVEDKINQAASMILETITP